MGRCPLISLLLSFKIFQNLCNFLPTRLSCVIHLLRVYRAHQEELLYYLLTHNNNKQQTCIKNTKIEISLRFYRFRDSDNSQKLINCMDEWVSTCSQQQQHSFSCIIVSGRYPVMQAKYYILDEEWKKKRRYRINVTH